MKMKDVKGNEVDLIDISNQTHAFWVVHGGSDSYFAALNHDEAKHIASEMNKIASRYGLPESYVDVDSDIATWKGELIKRAEVGDEEYFTD